MATTSPDNIRTPDPGDPFNLVPDLATLANDVQDALTERANLFQGTVSERAAFLATATPGMLWQDTDGIGMLWKRGAAEWVPAVWRWSGTTAQMNGFTQAPNGFEWFNTTNNTILVRLGGAWTPFRLSGTVSMTPPSGGGERVSAVTFSTPFAQTPSIQLTSLTGAGVSVTLNLGVNSPTSTGFNIILNRSNSTTTSVGWTAFL